MVEQQIRPWGVFSDRVLALYRRLPRERFVPEGLAGIAHADIEVPIGEGQRMLPPKVEARMLQELAPRPGDKALHVGAGSGFFSALLALMAGTVHAVEINGTLAGRARERIGECGLPNVTVHHADGARGFAGHAPYDIVVLTGSTPVLAEELVGQLAPGGRLLAPVGTAPIMSVRLVEAAAGGKTAATDLFEYYIDPLENAPHPPGFSF